MTAGMLAPAWKLKNGQARKFNAPLDPLLEAFRLILRD